MVEAEVFVSADFLFAFQQCCSAHRYHSPFIINLLFSSHRLMIKNRKCHADIFRKNCVSLFQINNLLFLYAIFLYYFHYKKRIRTVICGFFYNYSFTAAVSSAALSRAASILIQIFSFPISEIIPDFSRVFIGCSFTWERMRVLFCF